jgi:hypothetical protein
MHGHMNIKFEKKMSLLEIESDVPATVDFAVPAELHQSLCIEWNVFVYRVYAIRICQMKCWQINTVITYLLTFALAPSNMVSVWLKQESSVK